MVRAKEREKVIAMWIVNSIPREVTFCLEPWGELYPMPPNATTEVVARGPEGDTLEVDAGEGSITVYGWGGSIAQLFCDGEELGAGEWSRTPVPAVPDSNQALARRRSA